MRGSRDESVTRTSVLVRAFPAVTGAVGLLIGVSAILHSVLSVRVAYVVRGVYDSRLSEMLCAGAAAVFLVCTAILAPVQPGFYAGLPIYGGYLLLAALVRGEITQRR